MSRVLTLIILFEKSDYPAESQQVKLSSSYWANNTFYSGASYQYTQKMKIRKKLSLADLKVESFVTQVSNSQAVKSGALASAGPCFESVHDTGSDSVAERTETCPSQTQTCFTVDPAECQSHDPARCDSYLF